MGMGLSLANGAYNIDALRWTGYCVALFVLIKLPHCTQRSSQFFDRLADSKSKKVIYWNSFIFHKWWPYYCFHCFDTVSFIYHFNAILSSPTWVYVKLGKSLKAMYNSTLTTLFFQIFKTEIIFLVIQMYRRNKKRIIVIFNLYLTGQYQNP